MPYLTIEQRNLLAPANLPHPRDGEVVPTTDQGQFLEAACWAWALVGEYEHVDNPFSANTIYNSDSGAFVFNVDRVPIGLNDIFFATTDAIFPTTIPYHTILVENFASASGGNAAAQDRCRVALMTLTAIVNEHVVLAENGSNIYTMVMNTNRWFSWDH